MSQCVGRKLLFSLKQAYYGLAGDTLESNWHFALNFYMYTHFTSPIRRYSDIIVHRQLETTLSQPIVPLVYLIKLHKI